MGKLPLVKEKVAANAIPPIEAIEVAVAEHFDYLHNIVVFNVNGWSAQLPFCHECDVLVCSKAGYLKVEYINTTDLPMPRARTKIKLTTKQQLELALLGSIRCVSLKKKINKLKKWEKRE